MHVLEAFLLGLLQGLTEFLPVSSSGHLVILQHYMGFDQPMLFFDVLLHVGTLCAVVFYFRKELLYLVLALIKIDSKDPYRKERRKFFLMVILGVVPTALLGLFLKRGENLLFRGVFVPATMLIFTGIFLWIAEKKVTRKYERSQVNVVDAILIGLTQGVAVIPGISRSGITISCGLLRGLKREQAFQFSFFIFIPAVIGALILESKDLTSDLNPSFYPCLVGFLTAFFVSIAALKILREVLRKKRLTVFSWYCWILGGGLLFWEIVKFLT